MDQLVDKIASAYETFTKAKNLLLALPFKLELSAFASFDTTLRYDNSKVSFFKAYLRLDVLGQLVGYREAKEAGVFEWRLRS
jgi:hypothetical protein